MQPIERDETYTKWEQDAITMLLLHLSALLICLYLGRLGYVEDTAPVIFVLAVFLTGFFTDGYLWSLLGSLRGQLFFYRTVLRAELFGPGVSHYLCDLVCGRNSYRNHDGAQP